MVFGLYNKDHLYCDGDIFITQYGDEYDFKKQKRKIRNVTAFCDFGSMLLDDCTTVVFANTHTK